MKLSVIISTYNSVSWLEKVLWGYAVQNFPAFELIIADDGSAPDTKELIEQFEKKNFSLKHVWHEDRGFRKCEILNKAIQQSATDYLVFSDGDCIPRNDFLKVHFEKRKPGHFLSGGYFKLPINIAAQITAEDIETQKCFQINWLKERGLKNSFKNNKLIAKGGTAQLLNTSTFTKATWNGHNASGWKKDIVAVNGFDERMKYGGEDRELGERMMNNGIKSIQIRYSAICLHLDHERNYVNETDLANNAAIRAKTKKTKAAWTSFGITKGTIHNNKTTS